MAEAQPEDLSFEGQQAFDVADMVKQYFRELPEALLTNKLSETFVAIFQCKFWLHELINCFNNIYSEMFSMVN